VAAWVDNLAGIAEAVTDTSAFGDAATLPSGSTVYGVFDLFGLSANGETETSRSMRLSQQHNPTLALRDADAAALAEGDTLTVRGDTWRIARIDADGYGLTTLSLAPPSTAHAIQRWR